MVVKKITATQIVCSNGRSETRFRRKGLGRVGGSSWDHSTLIPVTDERFVKYEQHAERGRVATQVENLMVLFRRDDDEAAGRKACDLLADYFEQAATGGSTPNPTEATATNAPTDRCGACSSVRPVAEIENAGTVEAVCRDESACYAASRAQDGAS